MNATAKIERDYLLIPGATYPKLPSGTLCSIPACGEITAARGLCNTHYRRWHRNGTVTETKRPKDWGAREKHPMYKLWCGFRRQYGQYAGNWGLDFWLFVSEVGDRPSEKHHLERRDKTQAFSFHNALWIDRQPETKVRAGNSSEYLRLRRQYDPTYEHGKKLEKYGLSNEQYDDLLKKQNGVCAICARLDHRNPRLSIDHCHTTGIIRGLLCTSCNHAIGNMDDAPEVLESAARYLRDPPAGYLQTVYLDTKKRTKSVVRPPSPHVTKA